MCSINDANVNVVNQIKNINTFLYDVAIEFIIVPKFVGMSL